MDLLRCKECNAVITSFGGHIAGKCRDCLAKSTEEEEDEDDA